MGRIRPIQFFQAAESDLLQQAVLNKRRTVLKKVLLKYMGLSLSREQPELLRMDVEYAGLGEELKTVANGLGLKEEDIPERAQAVDIEINGVVVALDDEQQFNRFRLKTLHSSVYSLPLIYNLSRYRDYCQMDPVEVHTSGLQGKKTKDRLSLQKLAGPSEITLKLKAINDFMQDLLPLVHYVPVLRLSVFDQIETPQGSVSLHSLLMEDDRRCFELLADYFIRQLEDLEDTFNLEY